ncbi:hypothetical protein AgCh_022946 [Apium graveolens]
MEERQRNEGEERESWQRCGSSRRKRLPLLLFVFLSSLKSIFISSIHGNCQQRLRSGSRNDTFSVQGIGSTIMAPGQIVKQLQGIGRPLELISQCSQPVAPEDLRRLLFGCIIAGNKGYVEPLLRLSVPTLRLPLPSVNLSPAIGLRA